MFIQSGTLREVFATRDPCFSKDYEWVFCNRNFATRDPCFSKDCEWVFCNRKSNYEILDRPLPLNVLF